MQEANNTTAKKDYKDFKDYEDVLASISMFDLFYYKKINERHYYLFCKFKELVDTYEGYFLITLHSALFSSSEYADCLMNVMREKSDSIRDKIQIEFFEDVYAFLKKDKKQQICQLYEKYKHLWHSSISHDIGIQAIKVSIAYLFVLLGVELPEPMYDFIEFKGKVYVDFDKVDTQSLEEAVKYLGYIPIDFSSPSVIINYYEHFSSKVYSLKNKNKKGILERLRKHKCETKLNTN